MEIKYKKLVVAVQAAIMTSLVCSALPSYASDVELYKAPQTSVPTIMFMMDVSGSMNFCDIRSATKNSCQTGDMSRLDYLKGGMIKLLQGDANTEPLPDKLVVGLSEFGGTTGRIKLEAKSLGDSSKFSGDRPIFQTAQVFQQPASSSVTQTRTSVTNQIQTETGTRTKTCRTNNGTSTGGSSWCNVSTVTNWTVSENWTPEPSNSSGSWSSNTPSWVLSGDAIATGGKSSSECITWNTNGTSCTYWEGTVKTVNDFGNVTSTTEKNNITYTNQSSISNSTVISGSPSYGSSSVDSSTCNSNQNLCTRKSSRSATVTSTRTASQTSTGTYTLITTYYGTGTETHRKKMLRAVKGLSATDGTPTAFAYAEVAAYLLGQKTSGTGSGFSSNVTDISNSTNYIKPASIDKTKQCNRQGIYFLTDGVPEYTNRISTQDIMRLSLNDNSFKCDNTSLDQSGTFYDDIGQNTKISQTNWKCIATLNQRLLSGVTVNNVPQNNPQGVQIKTAVVGFGDIMSGKVSNASYNNDIAAAKKWGTLGLGGFYQGSDDESVVASVKAFLRKLQKYIPPVTTGSVTIPVDNLDTQNVQPWGYFPQFDPAPDAKVTTWAGNLKKYQVVNSLLKDRDGKLIFDATTGVTVDDPNDYWADSNIKKTITKVVKENNLEVEKEFEVRVGGVLSQFKLGNVSNVERKILTDRKVSNTGVVSAISSGDLLQVTSADLKVNNTSNNFSLDKKRGYLAALFGYDIPSSMALGLTTSNNDAAHTAFSAFLTQTNATLRQMGAVMHSKPLLITQQGTTKLDSTTGDLSYTDRDDLVVFGTTQGLLHVVRAGSSATDSNAGKEVFTFVPSEMVDNQSQGFLNQDNQGSTLAYGVDGPWTAYTEYVTKYGSSSKTEPVVSVKGGKQWLYGGLRMGGKSYYALDLSDVTSTSGTPKLKFKIDPESAEAYSPTSYMGQSWSKPTIAWVNWQGKRKLVMLVGGGYDPIYENIGTPTSTSVDQGAGVYMFDADDGTLLWWASANASANKITETKVANMKRSVVSQIKAIDRNTDGLVDHLYFGDLGGQMWRVDLDDAKTAGETTNIAKRVTRILNQSTASDVPRFYTTPTFTIHNNGGSLFAALTIGSGNLSSPMSENNKNDALYVVYDKDVTRRNLSVMLDSELSTVDVSTSGTGAKQLVKNTSGNTATSADFGGWYYPLASKKRFLNDNVAIDNDLYTSVFDANDDIDDVDCYGGVRGNSKVNQFCLPYGQCTAIVGGVTTIQDRPKEIDLGKGNIGISFGGKDKTRGLVLNFPTAETLKSYSSKTKFISQRWFER